MKLELFKKYQNYLLILFFFIICIYDIGNVDALRQGTEGFYLLISNEMYRDGYFLTPRLVDGNHWSKPPFHFWLPMPLQLLLQGSYLTSARLSILIFSFLSIILIANWYKRLTKTDLTTIFFFFTSSFCVLKYSRIYMMEIPFSFLIFLSTFSFFYYSKVKDSKLLYLSIIFSALGVLVKGPVSLAIATGSLIAYKIFNDYILRKEEELSVSKIVLWFISSVSLSSLWFIYCYITYGNEFYDYFILRENLGKFSAKSYPISSLINGLLIYSFPLILFLPRTINRYLKKKDSIGSFLAITFLISFFIWFIPNQKSHHYAIPSIIPLILFIFHYLDFDKVLKLERRIINIISTLVATIIFTAGLLSISLDIPYLESASLFRLLPILIFIVSILILKLSTYKAKLYFFCVSTFYAAIWIFFVPIFLLPTVPDRVVDLTKNQNVSVVFRKPYFLQEGLGKEVEIYSHNTILKKIHESQELYIVPRDVYDSQNLAQATKIIHSWPLWKRGLKPREILRAIKADKSQDLVEYLVLLERQQ